MTMITPSYLGETIEYSSLHACRSTLEDPTPGIGRNMRSVSVFENCLQKLRAPWPLVVVGDAPQVLICFSLLGGHSR